ncbi:hypothetical protein MKX03_033712 [Papaver bracteatum]|nr:hypothetical protein MKX03_033712 [Papaver bracteatum]
MVFPMKTFEATTLTGAMFVWTKRLDLVGIPHINVFAVLGHCGLQMNDSAVQTTCIIEITMGVVVVGGDGGSKTVGRWLKDIKEKKREETMDHNAQLHAVVFIAVVTAVVAAIAAAIAASAGSGKHEQITKTVTEVASATTLVAAQCV